MNNKNYKNDPNWIGYVLLHEKELHKVEAIKEQTIQEHGDVSFELLRSPSSGEIFMRFFELHITKVG